MTHRADQKAVVELYDRALGELQREGMVRTARCEVCGHLLRVQQLTPAAWTIDCPCGRYRDTLRGS
jgi:hypothetical protein